MARILIAEDDPLISSFLEKGLRANGFTTTLADNGERAQHLSLTEEFDLLILDMGLPARDGFHVLQELRSRGKTMPVLVLTGRGERDVVGCLEAGADDYMKKPFHFDELVARVRTRLRAAGTEESHVLSAGDMRLDLQTRRVTVGERTVELTAREFSLLETLLRHAGQVLSREQLLSQVWGYSFDPSTNLVNVYVNSLRKKVGAEVIETVRGVGYRLRAPVRVEVRPAAETASGAAPSPPEPLPERTVAQTTANRAYLIFISKPGGYRLEERHGELPRLGEEIELNGGGDRLTVFKVGASPLPGDKRPCVFLQA